MRILLTFVVALVLTLPVMAQDEVPEPLCDRDIDAMVLLQNIQTFREGGSVELLESAAAYLDLMLANCEYAEPTPAVEDEPASDAETIVFSSEQDGMQAYIGPVELPDGVYRVSAVTDGFLAMGLEADAGECLLPLSLGSNVFNLSAGDATLGAQNLMVAEGCVAYFDVSNTSEPWQIEFVTLTADDLTMLAGQYDSEEVGRQPVMGPLYLNDRYRLTVTTEGFFSLRMLELDGDCGAQRLLFNLSSGEAVNGASSGFRATDCVGFIGISNTSEPWTLDVEVIE